MSVGFFIANPQEEKSSIDAIVRYSKKRYKKGIGVSVIVRNWDKQNQRALISRYKEGNVINVKLKIWEDAINRALYNMGVANMPIPDNKHFWTIVQCVIDGKPYPKTIGDTQYFTEYFNLIFNL